MTLEEQYRDLQVALHAAASLQATIRHADAKAQILLGAQGAMAVLVVQQVAAFGGIRTPALLAVAGLVSIAWLVGLTISGWHLLATIVPRLAAPSATNRFAFPAGPAAATGDLGEQRDEAWQLVSALADIAWAKHSRVRRSQPALILASAAAGALVALATTVGIAT